MRQKMTGSGLSPERIGAGIVTALCWIALVASSPQFVMAADPTKAVPGASLPPFMSLKTDRVDIRSQPDAGATAAFAFQSAGWPVKVLQVSGDWVLVVDVAGSQGWVSRSLLSRRRTALVNVKAGSEGIPLKTDNRADAQTIAILERGIVAGVFTCDGRWCEIGVSGQRGYVDQARLWGVAEGEALQ